MGADRPFGGHRMPTDEVAVRNDHTSRSTATRAGPDGADHHVARSVSLSVLAVVKAQECVDLPLSKELHRLVQGMGDPVDVSIGVEAHIRREAGNEHMLDAAQAERQGDGLALEITERMDGSVPKSSRQPICLRRGSRAGRRRRARRRLAATKFMPISPRRQPRFVCQTPPVVLTKLHIGEALQAQEFVGHIQGSLTDCWSGNCSTRNFVVSGGGSAATGLDADREACRPASVRPTKNRRRLNS